MRAAPLRSTPRHLLARCPVLFRCPGAVPSPRRRWIEGPLYNGIYGDTYYNGQPLPEAQLDHIMGYNKASAPPVSPWHPPRPLVPLSAAPAGTPLGCTRRYPSRLQPSPRRRAPPEPRHLPTPPPLARWFGKTRHTTLLHYYSYYYYYSYCSCCSYCSYY